MALTELIAPWVPIGGLALVLLFTAYHGWEAIELLTKVGMYAKVGLAMLVLLAAGIALGVIEGFDVARLLELGGMVLSFLLDLVPIGQWLALAPL
ncbi:hypothetical protein SAMN05216388_10683 [Halorientalis persicus]|uniref:Uncharacterized protein n=1 Tax=Halorientalis persicus TaxID=1367881 RepID=A0A1H8WPL7_9EURY|nr:hypothetical protein [Halorientalis persicus]SEP29387.1 hypothetical protein SAMN05216388_10683 [Halorientalis persicus]